MSALELGVSCSLSLSDHMYVFIFFIFIAKLFLLRHSGYRHGKEKNEHSDNFLSCKVLNIVVKV